MSKADPTDTEMLDWLEKLPTRPNFKGYYMSHVGNAWALATMHLTGGHAPTVRAAIRAAMEEENNNAS
jgi:hypothetical protein